MKDPVKLEGGAVIDRAAIKAVLREGGRVLMEGGAVIDRAAIKAVLREGGRVLIFFGGERPLVLADNFSTEEIEKLSEKTE